MVVKALSTSVSIPFLHVHVCYMHGKGSIRYTYVLHVRAWLCRGVMVDFVLITHLRPVLLTKLDTINDWTMCTVHCMYVSNSYTEVC